MRRYRPLLVAALAAPPTMIGALPTRLAAQAVIQPLGQTDADLLAAQMRILAGDPRNVQALATAGELSLRLGDLSGAAALFARADKVDPHNGRVKAGMGSILVRSERPGEALRFFTQAETYGWPAQRYAADRGLAFDLVGQQGRAQRDYRLALGGGADDETTRRYALSLGISGQQAAALAQLDPLVRRQDRAAWRARAFVMAMNGDNAGATHIATTMMPAGMAQGLAAFFQRLPTLSPTDRAFAVHFGEIAATPERLADARLAPAYAPLAPEPAAQPVQVAAVAATPIDDRRDRRSRRDRQPSVAPAVTTRAPTALAANTVATPRPVGAAMRENDVRVAAPPPASAPPQPAAARPVVVQPAASPPVPLASTAPAAATTRPSITPSSAAPTAQPGQVVALPTSTAPTTTSSPSTAVRVAAVPRPSAVAPVPTPVPTPPAPVAPVQTQAATERADSVLARIVANLSIPASELGVEPTRPDPAPVAIPASVERAPASSAGRRVVAQASAQEGKDAALRRTVAARLAGDAEADEPSRTARGRRTAAPQVAAADTTTAARRGSRTRPGADEEEAVETPAARGARTRRGSPADEVATTDDVTPGKSRRTRRGVAQEVAAVDDAPASRPRGRKGADEPPLTSAQRRAADRKLAADKKAAAEKKELADKAAAEKKAARAQPSRIWVQVAGGANEGDLGKAWSAAQAKTPALKGRAGYTTPLRATNRVLTGPFKTDAEARAFVNQLSKQGVSAFSFTSDAGQKVEKLGAKKSGK